MDEAFKKWFKTHPAFEYEGEEEWYCVAHEAWEASRSGMTFSERESCELKEAMERGAELLKEQEAQLSKVLRDLKAAPKWQPIETAPKDGTEIFVYREDAGSMIAQWIALCDFLLESHMINFSDKDWEEPDWFYANIDTGGRLEPPPTLWQPKPEPPKQ